MVIFHKTYIRLKHVHIAPSSVYGVLMMRLQSLFIALIATSTILFSTNVSARVGPAYDDGSSYGYACTHHVNGHVLLRSGPGQNYKALARMPNGSDVSIIGERTVNGWLWYKIKFCRNMGWARSDYICR